MSPTPALARAGLGASREHLRRGANDGERRADLVKVAALLQDVGTLGVPAHYLSKPDIPEALIPPHFTNIQHSLRLARQLLAPQDTPNRQIT